MNGQRGPTSAPTARASCSAPPLLTIRGDFQNERQKPLLVRPRRKWLVLADTDDQIKALTLARGQVVLDVAERFPDSTLEGVPLNRAAGPLSDRETQSTNELAIECGVNRQRAGSARNLGAIHPRKLIRVGESLTGPECEPGHGEHYRDAPGEGARNHAVMPEVPGAVGVKLGGVAIQGDIPCGQAGGPRST